MTILGKFKRSTNRSKQSCGTNNLGRNGTWDFDSSYKPHSTWKSLKSGARTFVNNVKDAVVLNDQNARQGASQSPLASKTSQWALNPQKVVRYYPTPGFVPSISLLAHSPDGNAPPKPPLKSSQDEKQVPSSPVPSEKHNSQSSSIPASESKAFFDRYKNVKMLGSGGNGQVFLCENRLDGAMVAVKVLRKSPSKITDEVSISTGLRGHENIVRYLEYCEHPTDPRKGLLIMEHCHGDLEQWKSNYRGDVPEAFLWSVFKQMSAALAHIHSHGIVHGDFKHLNVLCLNLPGKKWPILKLADFGSSVVYPDPNIPRAHFATFGWTPPEAETRFGQEVDVWGLGSLIHWLALGRRPVQRVNIGVDPHQSNYWFYFIAKKSIPAGVYDSKGYISFCLYNAEHRCSRTRIDIKNEYAKAVRSKLLNYFMLRALDMKYYHRISSFELNRFMNVLEPFVQEVGRSELDRFNDGHDQDWTEIEEISDSQVILQIFECIQKSHEDLSKSLLKIMDGKDFATAHRILGRPMLRGPQIAPDSCGAEVQRKATIARKPLPHPEKPKHAHTFDFPDHKYIPGAHTRARAFLTQPNPFA